MRVLFLLLVLTLVGWSQDQSIGKTTGDNASNSTHAFTHVLYFDGGFTVTERAKIDSIQWVPRASYAGGNKHLFAFLTRSGNTFTVQDTFLTDAQGTQDQVVTEVVNGDHYILPGQLIGMYNYGLAGDDEVGARVRRDLSNTAAGDSVIHFSGNGLATIGNAFVPNDSTSYSAFADFFEIKFFFTNAPLPVTEVDRDNRFDDFPQWPRWKRH